MRNYSVKEENKERIKLAKESIIRERIQNKEIKQVISKVLEEKRSRDREDDINFKKSRKFHLLYEKNQNLTKKIKVLEDHHLNLKQGYSSRLLHKNISSDENKDRIKKLEQLEGLLIDKLKQTHSRQQHAYKDLEKIVHDGYGYYLKSFVDRKDKHLGMFCNGKLIPSASSRNMNNSQIINKFLSINTTANPNNDTTVSEQLQSSSQN